jgi:hypothetical protein
VKIDARIVVAVIHQLAPTQRLQLHELIAIALFRQKLIVRAGLAHLDEVAA